MTKQNLQQPLLLASPDYAILMALAGKERHGYEIMKYVEGELKQDVAIATLYRHIRKLVDADLIELDRQKTATAKDSRRRYYRLTGKGARIFATETNRILHMAQKAQKLLRVMQPRFEMGTP